MKTTTDSRGLVQEVSKGNKDSINNWARDHSCDILAKKLVAFYPCPENLMGLNFKVMA